MMSAGLASSWVRAGVVDGAEHDWFETASGSVSAGCGQEPPVAGVEMSANVLWIIAVLIAIIGVIVLISGSVLWGIILLVLAALVGPGGYSIFNRHV